MRPALALALLLATGCLGESDDPEPERHAIRHFYLIGDALTPGQDLMTIEVDDPGDAHEITAQVADLAPLALTRASDGTFFGQQSLLTLGPGEYDVLLIAEGATTTTTRIAFTRSAPYYVTVTTDWDHADPGTTALTRQETLRARHPALRMTHFVGPYTFTDPALTNTRRQSLAYWLQRQRDESGDEIALHIHPYCHFVESAGLPCITDQSTVYSEDPTGYTIKVAAYDREQTGVLLDHAGDLFEQYGLDRARSFRAGGWTADGDTLRALDDHGFIADSSALNWARIDEWRDQGTGELYRWNSAHWHSIDAGSQPYRPNSSDILDDAAPTLSLLEVPINGAMIDYVTASEMIDLFTMNWNGGALAAPRTLMLGFHPSPGFTTDEYERLDAFLAHADRFLARDGAGPVVYVTVEQLAAAYPP